MNIMLTLFVVGMGLCLLLAGAAVASTHSAVVESRGVLGFVSASLALVIAVLLLPVAQGVSDHYYAQRCHRAGGVVVNQNCFGLHLHSQIGEP